MAKKTTGVRRSPTPPVRAAKPRESSAPPANPRTQPTELTQDNRERAAARREEALKRRAANRRWPGRTGGPKRMKVRATRMGFLYNRRFRRGNVFVLEDPSHFSSRWMVEVDPKTPEHSTVAKDELKSEHDRVLGQRLGIIVNDDSGPDDLEDGELNPLDV